MDKKTANEIVQKQWNEMEVISGKRSYASEPEFKADNSSQNTAQSPSIEELKKKYIEAEDNGFSVVRKSDALSDFNENVSVKLIGPKTPVADSEKTERKRTVIFSKDRLMGSQG